MYNRYYLVRVSKDDPYAPIPGVHCIEYRFPSIRKALRFAEQSIEQGLYVTVSGHYVDDDED